MKLLRIINNMRNNHGASLLEVLIAMIILTVAFLGVMALSISLLNSNALATKINTATSIAQMQVSQLNCLGATGGAASVPGYFNTSPIPVAGASCPAGAICYEYYEYTVAPTILTPDTRNNVTTCINPALATGGPPPGELPYYSGLGITNPGTGANPYYTVIITFFNFNPPNLTITPVVNAEVEVGWQGGQHIITMYDIIS